MDFRVFRYFRVLRISLFLSNLLYMPAREIEIRKDKTD